jgi:hypothetical protein
MNAATFLACAMLVVTTGANAVELSRNGADAVLSGPIQSGDDHIFHLFLSKPGAPPIRNLYLNSPGGMVFEAYKISELVRAAGITTVVDAARARCDSACTAIFISGVKRYYLNARSIVDGATRPTAGLGFHQSMSWSGQFGEPKYSWAGSDLMSHVYREMGVPGAADLADRANFTGIYRVSGGTALSLGIATALQR